MIRNAIGQSDSIISIQQFRAGLAFTASLPGAPRTRNPYRHFVAVFITYIRVVGARRERERATELGRDGVADGTVPSAGGRRARYRRDATQRQMTTERRRRRAAPV